MGRPRLGQGTDALSRVFAALQGEVAEVSPNLGDPTRKLGKHRQYFPNNEDPAVISYRSAKLFCIGGRWWGVAHGRCVEPKEATRLWEDLFVADLGELNDLGVAIDKFWELVRGCRDFQYTYAFSLSRGRIGSGVPEFAEEVLAQALHQHCVDSVSKNDHILIAHPTKRLRDVGRSYHSDLDERLALNLFEYMHNHSHEPALAGV